MTLASLRRVGTEDFPAGAGPLVTIDRVHAARDVAAEAGVDLLVLTPGLGSALPVRLLRARHGAAHGARGAAARGAVPRRPAAGGADGRRQSRRGPSALELLAWDETDDPFALLARTATARLGSAPARVAVGARSWAEHALGVQRALPGSALELASPVVDRLRMVKSPAEVEELALAGAAIDRVHARMADWLRVGPHRGRGGRRHRRGHHRGGPHRRRLHDRRVGAERREPAPRAVRADDRGR